MEDQNAVKKHSLQKTTTQSARETVSGFETTDLTPVLRKAEKPIARQPRLVASSTCETTGIDIQVDTPLLQSLESKNNKARRGIPSWLTSLILHLSLITSLALVSVSGNGRKMIDLIASSEDSISLTNLAEVEFELETPEITPQTTEIDFMDDELSESEELSAILEESIVEAEMASDSDQLFESIASAGMNDSDLPRRGGSGDGARFFGIDGQGSKFVFIVDCSGSMADFGRWKQAKRELRDSINGLAEDQKFLILLYNDGFVAMNDKLQMVQSTAKERRKALRWLNRNRPDSWTFCAEALEQALAMRPDAVFLLSDGEFNDRNDVFIVLEDLNDKTRLQRLNRRQTPVHTVALGSHVGRLTMQQIAEENSGVFKLID